MTIQLERPSRYDALKTLIDAHLPGHSLQSELYTSRDVFDFDIEAIFSQHWLFVAAEAELPEAGDFVTVEVGPSSVIVVNLSGRGDKDVETAGKWFGLLDGDS